MFYPSIRVPFYICGDRRGTLWCCRLRFLTTLLFAAFQSSDVSVFEVNIRFVGGLLSAYALTGDQVQNKSLLKSLQLYCVNLAIFDHLIC